MKKVILIYFILTHFLGFFAETQASHKQATSFLITYIEELIAKNIINSKNLEELVDHEEIRNPIAYNSAQASDTAFVYHQHLDQIIAQCKQKKLLDLNIIKEWMAAKREELTKSNRIQEEVYNHTKEIYYPMHFVPIPASTYTSAVNGTEFVIQQGAEIQETPVTQYQWASVMGNNPSEIENKDTEVRELEIAGKKIKLLPDHPVTTVSGEEIEQFLSILDKQDPEHVYNLVSIQEYEACLQTVFGADWITKVPESQTERRTVRSGQYAELHNKRIWGLMGSAWQFTRDQLKIEKAEGNLPVSGALVFCTTYASTPSLRSREKIGDLIRPIFYKDTKSNEIGLRLVRYPKSSLPRVLTLDVKDLVWDRKGESHDLMWQYYRRENNHIVLFNQEGIRFLKENSEYSPKNPRETVDYFERLCEYELYLSLNICLQRKHWINLDQGVRYPKLIGSFKSLEHLDLTYYKKENIKFIAQLTNLTRLNLRSSTTKDSKVLENLKKLKIVDIGYTLIEDITPLTKLPNLEELWLDKEQIARFDAFTLFNGTKVSIKQAIKF